MNNLPNPCPISVLDQYSKNYLIDKSDINKYITAIHLESKIPINQIISIFKLLQHTCGNNYIDVGCAVLSLMTISNDGIYVDLKTGDIKINENYQDLDQIDKAEGLCNSLKLIIAEVFAPTEPD